MMVRERFPIESYYPRMGGRLVSNNPPECVFEGSHGLCLVRERLSRDAHSI